LIEIQHMADLHRESVTIPVRTSEGGAVHIGSNNARGMTYCGSHAWGHPTRPAVDGERFAKVTCKKCSTISEPFRAEVEAQNPKVALADGVSLSRRYVRGYGKRAKGKILHTVAEE